MKLQNGDRGDRIVRFLLFCAVVVLLNIAGTTLFFRLDVTEGKIYSLSDLSKEVVGGLEEPLTIKAFFTEDLPQPYNNLEQRVRDLLEEYSVSANNYFNYAVHTIKQDAEESNEYKEMARDYAVYPIQIQNVEQDEVKLQSGYMGIAFIHGDMIETIPVLQSTENLEYKITTTIEKMIEKTSALLALEEPIKINLYLSEQLYNLGPELEQYPDTLRSVVSELNRENYGKLSYSHGGPSGTVKGGGGSSDGTMDGQRLKAKYGLTPLILKRGRGSNETGTETFAHIVIEHNDEYRTINVLEKNVFGYQIVGQDQLKERLSGAVDRIVGINKKLGIITSHGTSPIEQNLGMQSQNAPSFRNFNNLISETYTLKNINLKEEPIPDDIETLIIPGPKERFSEWELFQIDQFLMKGNSVGFFIDTYQELMPSQSNAQRGQRPVYIPIDTGLDKLLVHYGVEVKKSYVMDEECYIRRTETRQGGIQEIPFYNAPLLKTESINNEVSFLKDINELVLLNVSPVFEKAGRQPEAEQLLASSDKAWEMAEQINLYNPMMIAPPPAEERQSYPLAYLLEGAFESRFDESSIPDPAPSKTDEEGDTAGGAAADQTDEVIITTEEVERKVDFLPNTEGGKLFVIGTSTVLQDNLLDPEGRSSNSMMILNIIDYLSGREDYAVMRGKGQLYNPIKEVEPSVKTFIKTFNIAGLPIIVILIGIAVWFRRMARKKQIQMMFSVTRERG